MHLYIHVKINKLHFFYAHVVLTCIPLVLLLLSVVVVVVRLLLLLFLYIIFVVISFDLCFVLIELDVVCMYVCVQLKESST